jgi:RecB family exonuclease
MLPDGVRAALGARGAGVLPDLAEKRVGFDEERFLFAQLVAASPRVTLSWQEKNDDNLPLAVSPLVARLLASAGAPTPLPAVRQAVLDPGRGPLTASEAAIVTGLARDRAALRAVLGSVLGDGGRSDTEGGALAAARVELLDELDPQRGTPHGERLQGALGPFFGFVGAAGDDDPRSAQPLFVTHLERLAECPWRFFLERLLRLAPAPDPLEVLPGVEPRLVGSLVHEVLRAIVENEIGSPPVTLDEARLRLGVPVAWPDETRLARLLSRCAEAIVREEGLPLPGLARALAAAAAPILESAREREWDDDTLPEVLAAEIEGGVSVEDGAGRPRRIGFKADRVDRRGDALRLTDYKTGRSVPFRQSAPEARRREMLSAVERARLLQAAAYALAGGHTDDEGRYLYLHPDLDPDRPRSGTVRGADDGIAEAFGGAARAALSAWDTGAFFPRFLLQDRSAEHPHCERCEVRDACLRGDSGARLRFEAWLERHLPRPVAPAPATAGEAVLLALWPLGGEE